MTSEQTPALDSPELYLNRELSQLAFNRRVLELAQDPTLPLLERLKFLAISSTNLDEFFEIRMSELKQRELGGAGETGPDRLLPGEVLKKASAAAHQLVADQYETLTGQLIPALHDEGIRILRRSNWTAKTRRWVKQYFHNSVISVVCPIGLDPAHPFPRVLNKGLSFIILLEGKDAFGRDSGIAVVQAPRSLPRVIRLPDEIARAPQEFVLLSSIIHAHVDDLFPGMQVTGCYQFRVTRNSDLWVDEEEVDDLRQALEGELPSRRYGEAVRLEVANNCPAETVNYLQERFELKSVDCYQVSGLVNLGRLMAIPNEVDRSDLKFPPFQSSIPSRIRTAQGNLFSVIRRGDILLHHPYESFRPVLDLVQQAARDSKVLAIKQTLYRTGPDSVLIDALVAAAQSGKEVTVVIELRARFDEEANIALANRLQEAGAVVVYGVVGYKTHAKMIQIVRREGGELRNYVHLGTGNYHAGTSRLYTDYGFMTCDPQTGEDVNNIFLQLTSLGRASKLKRLLQSPFTLQPGMLESINREASHAAEGRPARIIIKNNSLIDPSLIEALYRASQAGVQIDLIVRGMCLLRPGVPGISDNIRVRSILGRFLEHTRVYHFHNDGDPKVYLSSADWMGRNLYRRVEACFPVIRSAQKKRVVKELEKMLRDNTQAWQLTPAGEYLRIEAGEEEPFSVQQNLLAEFSGKP